MLLACMLGVVSGQAGEYDIMKNGCTQVLLCADASIYLCVTGTQASSMAPQGHTTTEKGNLLFLTLFSLHVTTNALFAYHVGDVPVGCMSLQPQSDVNTHIRSDFKG